MTATTERRAILFACPGTTCPEAQAAYASIGRAAQVRFPGIAQRWAYTSAGIRRKLAAMGEPVPGPQEALAALESEGLSQVAVVPLHMTDGMEFHELAETAATFDRGEAGRLRVGVGHALMCDDSHWRRALKAILQDLPAAPDPGDRVVLVAHGSRDPRAVKTLHAAAAACSQVDSRLLLGMMLGAPGLSDIVRQCRAADAKRVWLIPCMVAAGISAREDIAGAGEQSWATALEQAGLICVPVVKGLGEYETIVNLWMDQVAGLLGERKPRSGSHGTS